MPADDGRDPLDRWLAGQVRPLPPPPGTFELITRRARRRKIRKAAITAVSAAAVAAAVAVAVPAGLALHLGRSPSHGSMAAGGSITAPTVTSVPGTRAPAPEKTASHRATPSARATPSSPGSGTATSAPVPPNFVPSSVTWDSTTTGWVIGQAGTPGSCANTDPYICTSVARTDDTGETWTGLPAPDTGAAQGTTGVSGLRFLNGTDGWAYGPELWSTHDGGATWTQVNTGGRLVTDLETVGDQAYALFATCGGQSAWSSIDHSCSSFTLETTVASADDWTAVGGVPGSLPVDTVDGGEGVLELTGTTGYLIAPDGMLYSGPVNGTAWHQVAAIPCQPGNVYLNNTLAHPVELAPAGSTASGGSRLALVCAAQDAPKGYATLAYISDNGGATWTLQSQAGTQGTAFIGAPASVTATPSGTIILATSTGIWILPLNASAWQAATLPDSPGKGYGFSYVGMTTPLQGVALGGDPARHAIWMTTDGGQSWSVVPVSGS